MALPDHPEIATLSIAHLDCDAFYAAIEKRDRPELRDKPVIVGGGNRGVVMTACYVARPYGIRSAMPMYRALKACPHAIVIRPDMEKYGRIGREVRTLMLETTPAVEPISIDEAFLDLTGTQKLHGGPPAETLQKLAVRIEQRIGITVSIGLSYNKFLAKLASGLNKPRGFSVIGRAEAVAFLRDLPVAMMWGVGPITQARLERDGIKTIGALAAMGERELVRRYGGLGERFARLARGEDARDVESDEHRKSLSAETTFERDIADPEELKRILWRLSEKVSARLKAEASAGRTVTLKLKTTKFKLRTRAATLAQPTQLADTIFRAAAQLLEREADGTLFRLIGVGMSGFAEAVDADRPDLADPDLGRRAALERTMDKLRSRFGRTAIAKGRGLGEDEED
jgi:DNA polymerase-4